MEDYATNVVPLSAAYLPAPPVTFCRSDVDLLLLEGNWPMRHRIGQNQGVPMC